MMNEFPFGTTPMMMQAQFQAGRLNFRAQRRCRGGLMHIHVLDLCKHDDTRIEYSPFEYVASLLSKDIGEV